MQTEKHKPLSPSYRIWFDRETERAEGSGNVKAAIYALHMEGYAAYETADGILVHEKHQWGETDGSITWLEHNRIFPIVAGSVDMGAVARFIGY